VRCRALSRPHRGSHRAPAQTSSSDSSGSVRLRPSSNQNRRHPPFPLRGCRAAADTLQEQEIASPSVISLAVPAGRSDPVLVAEDQTAGGVRSQTELSLRGRSGVGPCWVGTASGTAGSGWTRTVTTGKNKPQLEAPSRPGAPLIKYGGGGFESHLLCWAGR
jgi:hypothetical protein